MTNREWLNSLSDEELAKVVTIIEKACEQMCDAGLCKTYIDCDVCKANWLKKERVE